MNVQLFKEATISSLIMAATGWISYVLWGLFRSGSLVLIDNILLIIIPVLLIAGFLNRVLRERRDNT